MGYYYKNSAWRTGFIGGYKFEENGARLLDAYSGFFYANVASIADWFWLRMREVRRELSVGGSCLAT
jgi:hypothetical protein